MLDTIDFVFFLSREEKRERDQESSTPISSLPMTPTIPVSFTLVLALSFALHLGLIAYGNYHDARSPLKYTDVDYVVFSDAARLMWTGQKALSAGPLGGSWIGE